ncbi:hypothetical protein C2G38_2174937 [Gigaspora rosea]|uniref:SAP domain-containing protein n=1 Tax=Gigaspora rosea TaxID=44941 RepID=A0A397VL34_9GLOM|nr:hypothetical protein C2G38_2174937 [Gigaspora rosea]
MSQNKVKSVTIEDVSLSLVTSDVEIINKNNQSSFDTNFGHLSIEILKFLCHKLGVSNLGMKQDLVNRLGNEAKKRNGSSGLENLGKGKAVESDSDLKLAFDNQFKANVDAGQAFANIFGSLPSDNGNPYAKMGDNFPPWTSSVAGLLLDKALLTGQVEYVHLARQVALERAYVVRVADEDGWGVAAKMALEDSIDPMSELFSGKRERARMAAQLFPKFKRSKASSLVDGQQESGGSKGADFRCGASGSRKVAFGNGNIILEESYKPGAGCSGMVGEESPFFSQGSNEASVPTGSKTLAVHRRRERIDRLRVGTAKSYRSNSFSSGGGSKVGILTGSESSIHCSKARAQEVQTSHRSQETKQDLAEKISQVRGDWDTIENNR